MEDKLKLLIEEGKREGGITYNRFNEIFPDDCNSPQRIDEIFAILDAQGAVMETWIGGERVF